MRRPGTFAGLAVGATLALIGAACATVDEHTDASWHPDTNGDPDSAADMQIDSDPEDDVTDPSDSVSDTALDTPIPDSMADSAWDTMPDSWADTPVDTAPDTAWDSALDTALDTTLDTVPDSGWDTTTDTATDPDGSGGGGILVLVETCYSSPDHITPAISALGLTGVTTTTWDSANFYISLTSRSWDLVIVDEYWSTLDSVTMDALVEHVDSGGSLVFSMWSFYSLYWSHALVSRAGVTLAGEFTWPLPVYRWASSTLFSSPNAVPDLYYMLDPCITDGQYANATGATALAGYTPSPEADALAISLSADGRVLLNLFSPQTIWQDEDYDGTQDMVEVYQNEISMLYP